MFTVDVYINYSHQNFQERTTTFLLPLNPNTLFRPSKCPRTGGPEPFKYSAKAAARGVVCPVL